jgi:hypothetical protein
MLRKKKEEKGKEKRVKDYVKSRINLDLSCMEVQEEKEHPFS